jgi:type II secretory pathway pseudopilin PulG
VAERHNRTLVEGVRVMLRHMQVHHHHWTFAFQQQIWVRNRMHHSALPQGVTPFLVVHGRRPDVSTIRVFGCMVQHLLHKDDGEGKLAVKAKWGIHLGTDDRTKGWRVLDLETKQLIITREALFYEQLSLEGWKEWQQRKGKPVDDRVVPFGAIPSLYPDADVPHPRPLPQMQQQVQQQTQQRVQQQTQQRVQQQMQQHRSQQRQQQGAAAEGESDDEAEAEHPAAAGLPDNLYPEAAEGEPVQEAEGEPAQAAGGRRASRRLQGLPPEVPALQVLVEEETPEKDDYPDDDDWMGMEEDGVWEPTGLTVRSALAGVEAAEWKVAMKEEMDSLEEQETYVLTPLPKGKKLVGVKWVLVKKLKPDGTIAKFKGRLVAKGFSQREGIDFDATYAPVGSYTSARALLALAAAEDMELLQLDVKNAFLHGIIDKEIYIAQPEGFEDGTSRVCLLRKALYGLKQSPLLWYKELEKVLLLQGM